VTQLIYGHAVDAGRASIPLHSSIRLEKVPRAHHLLYDEGARLQQVFLEQS
jgi:hypothetical protein